MANTSRNYAEELLKPLDRSGSIAQRNLATDVSKTQWETIKNNFANLKANLESRKAQAQTDYSGGLADVASGGYDLSKANMANLAGRGLISSGMVGKADQQVTAQKGASVNKLLDTLGSVLAGSSEKLKSGGEDLATKANTVSNQLNSNLGNINAKDIEAQADYNSAAADIAVAKDNRDANNNLAASSRALSAANLEKSKELDVIAAKQDDADRKAAISALLANVDPETGEDLGYSDQQKRIILQTQLGVKNAYDVIQTYNKNVTATDQYKTNDASLTKDIKDLQKDIKNKSTVQQIVVPGAASMPVNIPTSLDANKLSELRQNLQSLQNKKNNAKVTYASLYDTLYGNK